MLEHADQIASVVTAGGITLGGLVRLWGAIKKKFDTMDAKRETQFTALQGQVLGLFSKHEELDQRRHEDNLVKFSDIRVALARAGLKSNGNGGKPAEGSPS